MATKKTTSKTTKRATTKPSKHNNWMEKLVFLCVMLAILLSTAQFALHGYRYKQLINEDTYQVVTLTNGQTFFGRLQKYGPATYALVDVYYIQTGAEPTETNAGFTAVSETTGEEVPAVLPTTEDSATEDTQVRVVPLTGDFHQPYNHIILNREHIVFWQNLQPSSPVLEAISQL